MLQVELDYKVLLTELIRKQISILGPDITLARIRKIPGLVLTETGDVSTFSRDPNLVIQSFIDTFVELYGLLAERSIEPILVRYGYSLGQPNLNLYGNQPSQAGVTSSPHFTTKPEAAAPEEQKDTAVDELNKLITDINKNISRPKQSGK